MRVARKIMAIILAVMTCLALTVGAFAADTGAKAVFMASEPDTGGNFTVAVTIFNAKFNAFQFVLRYDPATVTPTDKTSHAATSDFSAFSQTDQGAWMSTVGTSIDAQKGLIDFTGYVTPGKAVAAGAAEETGVATIGAAGLKVFTFNFKKLGSKTVVLGFATKDGSKPYRDYLPGGAAMANAGITLAASYAFELPASLGESSSTTQPDGGTGGGTTAMTKQERMENTLIMQIGNYAAAVDGKLCHIDSNEKTITPYIKSSRTMIPLAFVSQQMGAAVSWDGKTRSVTITLDGNTVKMTIGSKDYTVNGKTETMDSAPEIKAYTGDTSKGRTMVPLAFVAQALGKAVAWDADNRLVILSEAAQPWAADRQAEKDVTSDVLTILSPQMRDFV